MKKKIIQRTQKNDKLNSTMQHLVKKANKMVQFTKQKSLKNKIYQKESKA